MGVSREAEGFAGLLKFRESFLYEEKCLAYNLSQIEGIYLAHTDERADQAANQYMQDFIDVIEGEEDLLFKPFESNGSFGTSICLREACISILEILFNQFFWTAKAYGHQTKDVFIRLKIFQQHYSNIN